MIRVLIITTGYSSFVSRIQECSQLTLTGVLDCQASVRLERYCNGQGVPYQILKDQNSLLRQWIEERQPEVIAVFRMPFLLRKEIFSLPRYGSLNLHPSLLPAYRGPNPWFWLYYYQEEKSGITIHRIDEGEDTGDIVCQQTFPVPTGIRLDDLKQTATELGAECMVRVLCNLPHIQSLPQPSVSPTPRARNLSNYRGLIHWNEWPTERIWHLLRGFPEVLPENVPDLPSHTALVPHSCSNETIHLPPGHLTSRGDTFILSCKDGSIFLTQA
ncbi:MAG: hypothetical protein LUF85_17635 [Bacteroides sp.]|nr:hypothetical protein [Bacteroides sp.]